VIDFIPDAHAPVGNLAIWHCIKECDKKVSLWKEKKKDVPGCISHRPPSVWAKSQEHHCHCEKLPTPCFGSCHTAARAQTFQCGRLDFVKGSFWIL